MHSISEYPGPWMNLISRKVFLISQKLKKTPTVNGHFIARPVLLKCYQNKCEKFYY